MEEAELVSVIKECLDGRKESFSKIVTLYQKQIFVICYNFLRTHQDAEDAATEVFLKAFHSLDSFDTNYKFSTWIFRIAVNHLNDILRKRKRERKYLDSEFSHGREHAERATPESVFFGKIEKSKLNKALRLISIHYQNALMLKYYLDLSYQQISEIMDVPVNTVGSLLFRGKNELRDKLREMGV